MKQIRTHCNKYEITIKCYLSDDYVTKSGNKESDETIELYMYIQYVCEWKI